MKRDLHEQTREWIAVGSEMRLPQPAWLQEHLTSCESCREYQNAMQELVHSLRAVPVAADRRLVATTQLRVRLYAGKLQQRRERLWLAVMCCVLVALSSAITTVFLWQGFAWLGGKAQLPNSLWQVGFLLFWIAPTIAASFLFLAHGTHFADRNRKQEGDLR